MIRKSEGKILKRKSGKKQEKEFLHVIFSYEGERKGKGIERNH